MPIPLTLQTQLTASQFTSAMPGWKIVEAAKLLPPTPGAAALFGDSPQQALKKLMNAFFDYGRANFTWGTTSALCTAGAGMMKGLTASAACAAFSNNLKALAEACGITGIKLVPFNEPFITLPNSVCIDGRWAGNVRTDKLGFTQFKCFKFQTHYWLAFGGQQYDVCYNNVFTAQENIIYSRLQPADPKLLQESGLSAKQLYKLAKPLPAYDYLVLVQQNNASGWPTWQLIQSKTQLKLVKPQ